MRSEPSLSRSRTSTARRSRPSSSATRRSTSGGRLWSRATREALTNAAKFASDGGPVRLYAEIERRLARVFVDDRGPGFDPEAISEDRRGVRESIIGRMERHGGRAEIRSGSGEGTEVELTIDGEDR